MNIFTKTRLQAGSTYTQDQELHHLELLMDEIISNRYNEATLQQEFLITSKQHPRRCVTQP